MIDIEARAGARRIIQGVLERGLSPEDVETRWPRTKDLAVRTVRFWLWTLYDDDSVEVVQFNHGSEERLILNNAAEFLATPEPFCPRSVGAVTRFKNMLVDGVEWYRCELPWHARWPFPPDHAHV